MISSIGIKWVILVVVLLLVSYYAYGYGQSHTGTKPQELSNSIVYKQTRYEKCIYQCIEGKGEKASYCKSDLKNFIDNYDKYYSPVGVSSAFTDKYTETSNPQPQETANKALCFRLVVGCRVGLCKDYLNIEK